MGGERFDTPQPESYLFGENSDLNFLGSRPTPVSQFSNEALISSDVCSFHILLRNPTNPRKRSKVW